MRNSAGRASTRSLRASDDIRTYLDDRSRECDDQIDEIHERINERKRLSATAPLPSSSSLSLRSSRSPTMKKKSAMYQLHSDSEDYLTDRDYHDRRRHQSSSSSRPHIKPSMSQSFSSSRGILKSSSLSSSPKRPQQISQKHQQQQHRGILKKPSAKLKESPEQWFQRIMRAKRLSPLDLCDLFSYGDTRKHPRVPLSHVCEVMFDLDPEVLNSGHDPVTPEMEEFLYQFSFEGIGDNEHGGDDDMILVDVKDALRSLNIWQSGVTSPIKKPRDGKSIITSPRDNESPTKSIVLEVKNKKLWGVISSLQDANLRLSMQLDDASRSTQSSKPNSGKPRPFSTSVSINSASWLSINSEPEEPKAVSELKLKNSVVGHHEDDLIRIANQLQYSGVKQLEELLLKSDKPLSLSDPTLSGFVSLKQLRWLLDEHFQISSISETQLIESCLGMNFNAQAQLDYNEFVHVLLDILIYAIPKPSSNKRQQLFDKIKEYLDSGFPPHSGKKEDSKTASKSHHYQMLTALCKKYDLEGDQLISVFEMMRVFYKDLATHHALNLTFPLSQQEALRVLQPFIKVSGEQDQKIQKKTTSNFLSYPEFLQSLFTSPGEEDNESESKTGRQSLEWNFWTQLREALCSGNLALEPKIHAQLCKILKKVDPHRHFLVSQRNFNRILDQHLSSSDLDILAMALAQPNETKDPDGSKGRQVPASHGPSLRFDVFMKLVFGAPALQDMGFLSQRIVPKLTENETVIRKKVVGAMKKHGGGWETTINALRELINHSDKSMSHPSVAISTELTVCEVLYLFTYLDDGHMGVIELRTLWAFLKNECWAVKREDSKARGDKSDHCHTSEPGNHSHDVAATLQRTKQLLARCLDAYDFERALSIYYKQQQGVISQDQLLKEIFRMFSALERDSDDELDVVNVQQLLSHIAIRTNDANPELFSMGRLKLKIPIGAFFDELFDWEAMMKAMRLPQNLSEVKKAFEIFDWSKDGSIPTQDWSKAWRQICGVNGATSGNKRKDMAEWEIRVLQRRFSTSLSGSQRHHQSKARLKTKEEEEEETSIDYARLLVHLMDTQHQNARKRLKTLVVAHFQQKCAEMAAAKPVNGKNLTSQQIDRLFRSIDGDGKGHFNLRDLQSYLSRHFECDRGDDAGEDTSLVQNVNVMGFVLGEIVGHQKNFAESRHSGDFMDHQRVRATNVTRERFQEFMQSLMEESLSRSSSPKRRTDGAGGGHQGDEGRDWKTSSSRFSRSSSHDDDDDNTTEDSRLAPHSRSKPQVITSLRALELAILDISSDVASENGRKILPTRAFRYLSEGFSSSSGGQSRSGSPRSRTQSRPRSRSPTRGGTVAGSQSASPTRKLRTSTTNSMISRSQHRQVEAMALNPITPSKLKRVLLDDHNLQVATHIVSQFFLHIGSPSNQFLELLPFAKWVVPISLDMELKVRDVVKKMVMRGKGGGGKLDLDRFLGQLHRKLLDSLPYPGGSQYGGDGCEDLASDEELRFVPPSLLQTKLNQLGILLSRVDMGTLLRHFGMEEELEVDFALFLQRIVELSASLTPSAS